LHCRSFMRVNRMLMAVLLRMVMLMFHTFGL
jgi:hypothetical protein